MPVIAQAAILLLVFCDWLNACFWQYWSNFPTIAWA